MEMNQLPHLFTPIKVGNMTLKTGLSIDLAVELGKHNRKLAIFEENRRIGV